MSSQPPKNITEQKMLDSHLYDMSRQRFNFIVQCQWERKLFLEKQRRKTAVMRDLLRNVDLSNLPENSIPVARPREMMKTKTSGENFSMVDNNSTKSRMRPNLDSTSCNLDVFVTHKFSRSLEHHSTHSVSLDENRTRRALTLTATTVRSGTLAPNVRSWPLNDIRYTRLNEVLCENYPKSVHLQSRKKLPKTKAD